MSSPNPDNHHFIDVRLDARGLNCPLPILKAKFALNTMRPGQLLQVEATDPHSVIDFEAYCARTGHSILSTAHAANGVIEFIIQRAASPKPI